MSGRQWISIVSVCVAAMLQWAGPLYADDSSVNAVIGSAVGEDVLTVQRGGTQVINDMKLNGVVSDNQAYNLNTGNNIVSDGAFAGATGMPMLIQNSGNNVLIQNATILNVQLQ